MRLPRWAHQLYASVGGYFWAPCPLCSVLFGGHEWRDRDGHAATIPKIGGASSWSGTAICPACTTEGEGCVRWRAHGQERHAFFCSRMAAA